ncbi:hypothetical protein [Dehalococcoides mccartyi]|uniref:hypothetical protein n=1 Tax=Dehalococcoides mccartyi TaxID=61435 RepID=UPI00068AE9E9|nr:hypothetical protein [Dehalococcoides mccartyi]AQU06178.1 hypothetical protein B1777_05705 [Dehalococcoides mccartyi]AQU07620.1 hypothetical protein B1778_05505 [Dehalococcoides mccartyi]
MEIDVNNPIVRLCSDAIKAESEGRSTDALGLCMKAWEARTDAYDSCIVSHYMARYQDNVEGTFLWNQRALDFGEAVKDERVSGFFPSLYLNLGKSHEDMGDLTKASNYYNLALNTLNLVADGPYKGILAKGILTAIERTEKTPHSQSISGGQG